MWVKSHLIYDFISLFKATEMVTLSPGIQFIGTFGKAAPTYRKSCERA